MRCSRKADRCCQREHLESRQIGGTTYAYAAHKYLDHHRYWRNLLLSHRSICARWLGNLLKILVALICLAAIVQRLLPALGVNT